jgi:hypothetical protein
VTGAPVIAQEYVGTPGGNNREVIVKQGGNTDIFRPCVFLDTRTFLFTSTMKKSPSAADESFVPTDAYKNLEIHKVCQRFLTHHLSQNLQPAALADFFLVSVEGVDKNGTYYSDQASEQDFRQR